MKERLAKLKQNIAGNNQHPDAASPLVNGQQQNSGSQNHNTHYAEHGNLSSASSASAVAPSSVRTAGSNLGRSGATSSIAAEQHYHQQQASTTSAGLFGGSGCSSSNSSSGLTSSFAGQNDVRVDLALKGRYVSASNNDPPNGGRELPPLDSAAAKQLEERMPIAITRQSVSNQQQLHIQAVKQQQQQQQNNRDRVLRMEFPEHFLTFARATVETLLSQADNGQQQQVSAAETRKHFLFEPFAELD